MNNLNDIFFAPTENGDLTYEQVLEDVQRYFSENHASTIAGAGENDSQRAVTVLKELMVQYLVKRKYAIKGLTTEQLCARLYEDMAGYSFLKKWIYQPGVEEVNINAYNDIEVIMNSGRSIKIPDRFSSPQHAIDVVRRMLNACGMVIDDTMPSVIDITITDGCICCIASMYSQISNVQVMSCRNCPFSHNGRNNRNPCHFCKLPHFRLCMADTYAAANQKDGLLCMIQYLQSPFQLSCMNGKFWLISSDFDFFRVVVTTILPLYILR